MFLINAMKINPILTWNFVHQPIFVSKLLIRITLPKKCFYFAENKLIKVNSLKGVIILLFALIFWLDPQGIFISHVKKG